MAGFAGYRDKAQFERAFQRELDALSVHGHGPNGERPGEQRKKAKPGFRFAGPPGSPERMAQIERIIGPQNKNLMHTVARNQAGQEIMRAVKAIQSAPTPEAIQEAAQLIAAYDDVQVARAAIQAINPTGFGDEFVRELRDAAESVEEARGMSEVEAEEKRLADRQRLLHEEYRRVQGRPDEEQAVDHLAQHLGDALYSPEMEDDQARVLLRSQSEMAKRQRKAANSFLTVAAMEDEFRKRYGPGGVSDEEREKWERELREGTLEVYDRANPTPEQGARAAFESVVHDKAFKGTSPMRVALDAEFERMAIHDSDSEHKNAMREADAKEWERTHGSDGRPRDSDW